MNIKLVIMYDNIPYTYCLAHTRIYPNIIIEFMVLVMISQYSMGNLIHYIHQHTDTMHIQTTYAKIDTIELLVRFMPWILIP